MDLGKGEANWVGAIPQPHSKLPHGSGVTRMGENKELDESLSASLGFCVITDRGLICGQTIERNSNQDTKKSAQA
jgi:hypothetical protein